MRRIRETKAEERSTAVVARERRDSRMERIWEGDEREVKVWDLAAALAVVR